MNKPRSVLHRRPLVALTAILLACTTTLFGFVGVAGAHDPIFLTEDQRTPDTGPYMPDGTISWALYGTVLDAGDTRGFEFDLREGDELFVSLLIPNLAPEIDMSDDQLPTLELEAPDGTMTTIVANQREVFDEPFSNTSYVNLVEERSLGQAGRYRGVVTGNAPARWSVAIGEEELFFTETERSGERVTSFMDIVAPLQAWYSTPAGEAAGELAEGAAEMDMELLAEAMESGDASAPEGSLGVEDAADTSDTADAGSSLGWVAPVAVGALVVLGGGFFAMKRREQA